MAFKRNSVLKATEWDKHTSEYLKITRSENSGEGANQLQVAHWSMAAVGILSAIYIYKKLKKS